jgi:small subunit ribosomal protein S13
VARIAGVDLPKNKRMEIALTYIYGIGRSKARDILGKAGVNLDKKTDNIGDSEITSIRNIIDKELKVEGDLRRDVSMAVKRLMDLGAYRGLRHRKGLPVRADEKGAETVNCRQEEIKSILIRRRDGKTGKKNWEKKGKKEYI